MNETTTKIIKDLGWGTFIAITLTLIGAYVNTQLFAQSTTTSVAALQNDDKTIKAALFGSDGTGGMSAELNTLTVQVHYIYNQVGGK